MEKYKKVKKKTILIFQLEKKVKKYSNLSIRICINKTENRITFKNKTGYYVELLTPETMKLLESTRSKINKDNNCENAPHLQITEVVVVHYNIVNNDYQQDSRVLYTFFPNKSFGQLLDISHKNFIFLKAFDWEFLYIQVWFTDQNSNPIEKEKSITLVIN